MSDDSDDLVEILVDVGVKLDPRRIRTDNPTDRFRHPAIHVDIRDLILLQDTFRHVKGSIRIELVSTLAGTQETPGIERNEWQARYEQPLDRPVVGTRLRRIAVDGERLVRLILGSRSQ